MLEYLLMALNETYKMAENPPIPMSWEEYEKRLTQEWQTLLNSDPDEKEIQVFLEKHPCLLPGAFTMTVTSGHYPFPDAVISQPPLLAIGQKIPDFMWFSTTSLNFEIVLVEIEKPSKKLFTSNGKPTSYFTQAQTQLAHWRVWFENPENQLVFYRRFRISDYLTQRGFRISFVLIYGRRSEFEGNSKLSKLRAELVRHNEYLMSYDRLKPERKLSELYTVKLSENGFRAVAYPPTYVLRPALAENYSIVSGKEEAIDKCEWMSSERKEFIKKRFPYWEDWADKVRKGITNGTMFTGDFE
jgi:hypothetical protein